RRAQPKTTWKPRSSSSQADRSMTLTPGPSLQTPLPAPGEGAPLRIQARMRASPSPAPAEEGMLHHLTIEYGDDVLFSTGLTRNEFDDEARFLLAAKLYELGRLTSGQAAKL